MPFFAVDFPICFCYNKQRGDIMSKDVVLTFKGALYLFARVVLVCVLAFMSYPLSSMAPSVMRPILAVFYFIMLMYFFVFTMWNEGVRDRNRVDVYKRQVLKNTISVRKRFCRMLPTNFAHR